MADHERRKRLGAVARVVQISYAIFSFALAAYAVLTGELLRWAVVFISILAGAALWALYRHPTDDSSDAHRLAVGSFIEQGQSLMERCRDAKENRFQLKDDAQDWSNRVTAWMRENLPAFVGAWRATDEFSYDVEVPHQSIFKFANRRVTNLLRIQERL